jgi:hypothetical protein
MQKYINTPINFPSTSPKGYQYLDNEPTFSRLCINKSSLTYQAKLGLWLKLTYNSSMKKLLLNRRYV